MCKREFPEQMNKAVPGDVLVGVVKARWPTAKVRLRRTSCCSAKKQMPLLMQANSVSIRAKVEHPFRVIKKQCHLVKMRYRGLAKNTEQLKTVLRPSLAGFCFPHRNKPLAPSHERGPTADEGELPTNLRYCAVKRYAAALIIGAMARFALQHAFLRMQYTALNHDFGGIYCE